MVQLLQGFFSCGTVVAETFDLEKTSVGLKADLPESLRPVCCGSIVAETCTRCTNHCRLSRAKLDSYGRNRLGAFVPVGESDFGCCGPLFGGELALQKVKLDPVREPVS
jgi:hypothetical protein